MNDNTTTTTIDDTNGGLDVVVAGKEEEEEQSRRTIETTTTRRKEDEEEEDESSSTCTRRPSSIVIGVLALQGAFEEHEKCLQAIGCKTRQIRKSSDLNHDDDDEELDGIILPGGESTAMGLIATHEHDDNDNNDVDEKKTSTSSSSTSSLSLWDHIREFSKRRSGGGGSKPIWGTCAGMILLADRCVGDSAIIQDGQALIGGVNITVCRNYFGSQISSFELDTPCPPTTTSTTSTTSTGTGSTANNNNNDNTSTRPFPGIFIRAPAILSVGDDDDDEEITILGKVIAKPCRQAAEILYKLDNNNNNRHIMNDDNKKKNMNAGYYDDGTTNGNSICSGDEEEEEEEDVQKEREVICAVRYKNILCTAFHPELTDDLRWHQYFIHNMVLANKQQQYVK